MESLSDIMFHAEDALLPPALNDHVKTWIYKLIEQEEYRLVGLNFIFCSDEFLHHINLQYLQHDDYTDIITFDNSETETDIEGDIFISVDRVIENSGKFKVSPEQELFRVMAHGVLHLTGYNDKSKKEKKIMRKKEKKALALSSEYIP